MSIYTDFFISPIGWLHIEATENMLIGISLTKEKQSVSSNAIIQKAKEWLEAYFAKRTAPLPPLAKAATPFRQRVYEVTLQVPFGECRSYKDIAIAIGQPKAYRAVAQALKRNPYMLMMPCHRIIASKGLGGYNGGIEIKKKLLEFEGCASINL